MTPTFYCENCGKEVSANDKVCPGCAKFFTDVRCPRCNHSGDVDEFSIGCPKCGYLNPAWISGGAASASAAAFFEFVSPKIFEDSALLHEVPRRVPPRSTSWLFLSVTLSLGTLCAALVYVFMH
ncbi:MAG: hypothetical protein FWG35_04870 [Spirochaetaceae bacterium]|nr:hypothetical protein [Spirochaetaceae bacterium]